MRPFVPFRAWVICLALLVPAAGVPARADFAPDSIGGKVYRDTLFIASLRGGFERTIVFPTVDRFVFLKEAGVNTVSEDFAHGKFLLRAPRGDGSYVYTKIGASSATVELRFDDASTADLAIHLEFTSSSGGPSAPNAHPDSTFSLTDLATIQSAPAVNVSTRGTISPGHAMIVGFVVPGTRGPETGFLVTSPHANQRDVLIRAVGPSLTQFGVSGVWADPDFTIHRADGPFSIGEFHYGDWSKVDRSGGGVPPSLFPNPDGVAAFQKIFDHVGAFSLLEDSKDAADVVRLAPGAYTVVASVGPNDPGGEALVEVYFLP